MNESVPATIGEALEADELLLRQFVAGHNRADVQALVGLAVIAFGSPIPPRHSSTAQAFSVPRWGVETWLARRLRLGHRTAAAIVSAALDAASTRIPADLRAVAGRLEVHVPDPTWPHGLTAVR